jgi:hypothetical protein
VWARGRHWRDGKLAQLTFASQARRITERSEVVRALETKFLRFETRQEQDSVLSA